MRKIRLILVAALLLVPLVGVAPAEARCVKVGVDGISQQVCVPCPSSVPGIVQTLCGIVNP